MEQHVIFFKKMMNSGAPEGLLFGNTLTYNDIIYDLAQIFFYVIPAIGKRAYLPILCGNHVDRNGWN
jgi:hypothetical protein